MTHHFSIDGSSDKAKALLEYLRTLEFVKEESSDYVLTDEHRNILEDRRANRMSGKSQTYSWDETKNSIQKGKSD
ncbi:MAG: addiction module protein [Crocinitomicaceae bacterium]|nr:addiction module protein [Crocinitomicaceae bacterium]